MPESAASTSLKGLGAWGFVGAGALGASLARAVAARGARVVAATGHRGERARQLAASLPGSACLPTAAEVVGVTDFVVLAVPDDAIAGLDAALPWREGQVAIHLSGARGLDVLSRAVAAGAHVAALHPLMLFPRAEPSGEAALARFAGCWWAAETGDAVAEAAVRAVVAALDGHLVQLRPGDRLPYHLAAVLASNYVVTLLSSAVALWQDLGLDPAVAREALLPLVRATVERVAEDGPAAALSGPVARGDVGTVAAHLDWLRRRAREDTPAGYDPAVLAAAYADLARLAVPLAVARGTLTPETAARLLDRLREMDGTDRATL